MSYTVLKDHLEDQSIDGRIILKGIFRENIYIYIYIYVLLGHVVAQLVEAQVAKSRVRFPMVSLEFFFDVILPAALWHWS